MQLNDMIPLPSITIKSVKGQGFIATDNYGTEKYCKAQADLEEVIDNWAFAKELREESTDTVTIEMIGYNPVEEIDELIDSLHP